MSIPHCDIIRLTGSHEDRDPRFARLRRGFALAVPDGAESLQTWEAQNLVDRARIHALHDALGVEPVFAMESVLVLEGIPQWRRNPDVHLRVPTRYATSALPEVMIGPHRIPAASARQCRRSSAARIERSPEGIAHDDLPHSALLLAANRPIIDGFVAVSGVLRRLSAFDRFDEPLSRQREAEARRALLTELNDSESPRGARRAELVVAHASGACESVGEAALLALLSTIFPEELRTQHEVIATGRRYFLDFALPLLKIAFEFDGVVKMGRTPEEFRRAQGELMARQRDLEQAGWHVIRVGWDDLFDPVRLRNRLLDALRASGRWNGRISPTGQRIWSFWLRDMGRTR